MFDFLDSDWFNIGLEVVFVLLISYDLKKYFDTRKREYIVNIVLTIGFAVWTLYPYYTSYVGWEESQKKLLLNHCNTSKDTKLCKCIDEALFKEYTYLEYDAIDKNATEFTEFLKDTKEACNDSGWF